MGYGDEEESAAILGGADGPDGDWTAACGCCVVK